MTRKTRDGNRSVEVHLRNLSGWDAAEILRQAVKRLSIVGATFIGAQAGGIIVAEADAERLKEQLTKAGHETRERAMTSAADSSDDAAASRAHYIRGTGGKNG